uniref:Acyltransferase n=1 Tax=Laticauda laticaudata TaxID=8630 RepID=A0A8C5RTU2_LATLA
MDRRVGASQPPGGQPEKGILLRQLEALSVLQWVLTFLFFGPFFTLLLIYLLFTSFWSLSVLYFAWWIVDLETPVHGGRRNQWVRHWKVWELHRDYFPIQLVKTAELPPTRNYVLGSHPHGIICAGAFSAFSTEACGFSQAFPGLTCSLALLAGLFYLPVYREYMMSAGMVPVSKRSLDFLLQAGPGQAVVIVVGGATESLDCNPGEQRVHLSRRRGFVRLALQHGADLVPVFSFGENDIFRQWGNRSTSLCAHTPNQRRWTATTASTSRHCSNSSRSTRAAVASPPRSSSSSPRDPSPPREPGACLCLGLRWGSPLLLPRHNKEHYYILWQPRLLSASN